MWESPHNRQQCRMLGKEEDDGVKKAGEDMEQEECERLKEEILKIMRENNPSETFTVYEKPDRKPDGTTVIRLEVRHRVRGQRTWVPVDNLRAEMPRRVDAWKRLLKKVQRAHGMSTKLGSN